MNASSEAEFHVLATDYGKHELLSGHMFIVDWLFIAFFIDNFAGFFICKNNLDGSFQRAAAILSRTKTIAMENYNLVKQHLHDYGIYDEDLTIVISCD